MIRRSTWLILIVFIILAVSVFAWQRWDRSQQAQVTPAPSVSYLFDLEGQAITGLTITSSQGDTTKVAKDGEENWILIQPAGQPAATDRIEAAIGNASALRVLADLNAMPDFETIGLSPASYQVEITRADGMKLAASIGDLTPTQSGYYVFQEGKPIKIVERFGLDGVLDVLKDPPILQPIPQASGTLTPLNQP